jgi:D-lactate dehydrogenase
MLPRVVAAVSEPTVDLRDALAAIVSRDRILTRPIDRIAFASDASFYRLVPRAVVLAASVDEVRGLLAASRSLRIPLTFRAAGTSLSGQAVTDGLLVEVARHWKRVSVEDGGARVRVQPGIIGGKVNLALKPFGARIGPDPASINACTLGGILANNSSGMCCGVAQNAYHTLESLTFVLPSGTTIDTAAPDADARFRALEPTLADGLLALKRDVEAQPALRDRIRAKYRTKNTTGYSLNALLDFDRPVDIMRHLLIGSEGTLGFIAEAVLRTVPDLPVKYTGLLLFPGLHPACAAIPTLRDAGAVALEIMDRAALRSVQHQPGVPPELVELPPGAAGLLVEFQARHEAERAQLEAIAAEATGGLSLLSPGRFTHEAADQARLWTVRQGMFPSVGAVRQSGTTVIIEDVAFPIERLADAALDLTTLFDRHGYPNAIIFGHAKDGNLHFVITQSFRERAAIDQYARFMDDVVRLVVGRYDGALKAEHGTGRNMAPFVESEWGPEAVAIMRRLKALVDPDGLLNPGVILNDSPRAHLEHLKPLPSVEPEVDTCIECGYCEPFCPSRALSTTPRQRIVVWREMTRLREAEPAAMDATGAPAGDGLPRATPADRAALLASLEADYPYEAVDTCAVDGLCATACPVRIDTGQLTKRLRARGHGTRALAIAGWCASHVGLIERGVRTALRLGRATTAVIGDRALTRVTNAAARTLGGGVPRWVAPMPGPAPAWRRLAAGPAALAGADETSGVLYFPTCLTRVLGPVRGEPAGPGLAEIVVTLAKRAGVTVAVPPDAEGHCCGVPFSSKGFTEAHRATVARTVGALWEWSHQGRVPILVDASPCAYGLRTCRDALPPDLQTRFDRLRFLDPIGFAEALLPRLRVTRRPVRVALHPVCSATKMGLSPTLLDVARACAEQAVVPSSAGCCGFAGDRGFLVPELTASATAGEAAEVAALRPDACYSTSRTCEIGLTRATGRPYRSVLYLLEEATRP